MNTIYGKDITNELITMINQRYNTSFTSDHLQFDFVEVHPTVVQVNITAKPGTAYYGEKTIVYSKRNINKAFFGIPVRVALKLTEDTTLRDVVEEIEQRYGFAFDLDSDFVSDVLSQKLTADDTHFTNCEIPFANQSFVWWDKLKVGVADNAVNLQYLIQQYSLTELSYKYLEQYGLTMASFAAADCITQQEVYTGDTSYTRADDEMFTNLLHELRRDGLMTREEIDAFMHDLSGEDRKIRYIPITDTKACMITVKNDWRIGELTGPLVLSKNVVIGEPPAAYGYTFVVQGGKISWRLWGYTNYTVDWGDGTIEQLKGPTWDNGYPEPYVHEYSDDNLYTIHVTVDGEIDNYNVANHEIESPTLVRILKWDNGIRYNPSFKNCHMLTSCPDSIPSYWNYLTRLFSYCENFNDPAVVSWDTSNIIGMSRIFESCNAFNQPVGCWNISKVMNLQDVFSGCVNFNQDLSGWDVSNVTDMYGLFAYCTAFEGKGLENWDVAKVERASRLFHSCQNFNGDITRWNTISLSDASSMFERAISFNRDISGWPTENLTDVSYMFSQAVLFDQNLSDWKTSARLYGLSTIGYGAVRWQEKNRPTYTVKYTLEKYLEEFGSQPEWTVLVCNDGILDYASDDYGNTSVVIWIDGTLREVQIESSRFDHGTDIIVAIKRPDTMTDKLAVRVGGDALRKIHQYGNGVYRFRHSYSQELESVPNTLPADVTNISYIFESCGNPTGMETWDTSRVTDMSYAFAFAYTFNRNLSGWDTSSVVNHDNFDMGADAWSDENKPKFK